MNHPPDDHVLKVLIVAPNASSKFGGEAFLPLKYFDLLSARGHPVRLITHARNREGLASAFPQLSDRIDYIEDSAAHRMVWRAFSRLPARPRDVITGAILTMMTERAQAPIIRRHVARGDVDVIHQPIPVSPKQPSSVHGFGVPVVIGPMNGGMNYPKGYADHESVLAARTVAIARMFAVAMNWLMPGKRKAAALLVANVRTRSALPLPHPRIIELVENGVDLRTWTAPQARTRRADGTPFRLVFIGRLVGWKCVDMTLDAVARARSAGADITLDILGDGQDAAKLRQRAAGMGAAVRFHGFQPQAVCASILAASDALILNSIWECGGAVVLEAMALGLPVIASDWGGPADYLDQTCGILVHPEPRTEFVDRIADAILRLARDPDLCLTMGAAGADRVQRAFDWQGKIDRIEQIYRLAIADARRP